MRSGQVSIEYIIIVGVATLLLLPTIVLFYSASADLEAEVANAQITKVFNQLRDASDEVFYAGFPSKKTVRLYFPAGITNISFSGKDIVGTSAWGSFAVASAANLTGTLGIYEGIHVVEISALPITSSPYEVEITDEDQ